MARERRSRSRKKKDDVRFVVIRPKTSRRLKLPDRLFHPERTNSARNVWPKVEPKASPPDSCNLHWRKHRDDRPWRAKQNLAPCAPRPIRDLVRSRVGSGRARGVASGRATAAEPVGSGVAIQLLRAPAGIRIARNDFPNNRNRINGEHSIHRFLDGPAEIVSSTQDKLGQLN